MTPTRITIVFLSALLLSLAFWWLLFSWPLETLSVYVLGVVAVAWQCRAPVLPVARRVRR